MALAINDLARSISSDTIDDDVGDNPLILRLVEELFLLKRREGFGEKEKDLCESSRNALTYIPRQDVTMDLDVGWLVFFAGVLLSSLWVQSCS